MEDVAPVVDETPPATTPDPPHEEFYARQARLQAERAANPDKAEEKPGFGLWGSIAIVVLVALVIGLFVKGQAEAKFSHCLALGFSYSDCRQMQQAEGDYYDEKYANYP